MAPVPYWVVQGPRLTVPWRAAARVRRFIAHARRRMAADPTLHEHPTTLMKR